MSENTGTPAAEVTLTSTEGSETAPDPTKTVAADDPDFEYEIESKGPDGKSAKEKRKIKLSEARARFAEHDTREGTISKREALVQKYITEQLDPLNGMVEAMRKDPSQMAEFAKRLGVDFDKAVQTYAQRQVELANMTPEQRELHATKEELRVLKSQAEARQQQEQAREQQQVLARESERVQNEIVSAAREVKLPADPAVLMLMTNHLRSQVHQGNQPDSRAAATYVKQVLDNGFKSMLKDISYADIKKNFPEILTKIREGDIVEVKGGFVGNSAPRTPAPAKRQSRPIMSPSEFERYLKGEE